jgi:putative FmdB family regulatory protein
MPYYNYICDSCSNEWEEKHVISERDIPVNNPCPSCGVIGKVAKKVEMPSFGDPTRLGLKKPSNEFNSLLKRIHERTPGSNLATSSTISKI